MKRWVRKTCAIWNKPPKFERWTGISWRSWSGRPPGGFLPGRAGFGGSEGHVRAARLDSRELIAGVSATQAGNGRMAACERRVLVPIHHPCGLSPSSTRRHQLAETYPNIRTPAGRSAFSRAESGRADARRLFLPYVGSFRSLACGRAPPAKLGRNPGDLKSVFSRTSGRIL